MFDKLLKPESIAVLGASRTPGKVGYEILNNLTLSGFEGDLIPVNPSATEILGRKCYPDLKAASRSIDLGVIAVPTRAVHGALESCVNAGARAVIVITAGFREVGPEGRRLEDELVATCRKRNVLMLGPNCLGLINAHHGMNASFAKQMPVPGGISVLSQSGALCTAILDWAEARHLGIGTLISIGNKAQLTEVDFLRVLAEDDKTKVIVGYLESIASGDRFIKAAEVAAATKPVVVLKAGTTAAGQKATSSHTGSLAGADIAYGSAFRRSGVIRAEGFEELLDFGTAFAMQPLPGGSRVAIVTNAGGPGAMAADAVEKEGLEVATLGTGTATALKAKLPAAASVGNPIDVLGDADPARYAAAVNAAQDDPSVDAIIVILTPQAMTEPAETALAVAEGIRNEKPVLAVFMGGSEVMPGREKLAAHNLPDFDSPERAVKALKAMVDYHLWKHRAPRVITRFPVNRRRVARLLRRHRRSGELQVGEADGKEILRAYQFNVPSGQLVTTADESVEVGERIGYPLAMKIASPDIIHKSDLGGVRLTLSSPEEVRDAYDLMMLRIRQLAPKARIAGTYLEKMGPRGLEVILGMTRDPQFGPMLMFGLGGIFVEIMKDVAFHLAPITHAEAIEMLTATKSYALLRGARGRAGVDLDGIATALQKISQLVTDFPEIQEMDINPFIVGRPGTEPLVVDVRITLSPLEAAS